MRPRQLLSAVAVVSIIMIWQAQQRIPKPAFDVVSIKPNRSTGDLIMLGGPEFESLPRPDAASVRAFG